MPTTSNKNKVTIRVWKPFKGNDRSSASAINSFFQSNVNPGHVSIETDQFYASFWPAPKGTIEITVKGKIVDEFLPNSTLNRRINYSKPGDFIRNLSEDEKREGKPADTTIELTKLDVKAMHEAFSEFYKQTPNWTFLGHSFVNNYSGESCASVAYALLTAGKIENLIIDGCGFKEYINFSLTKVKLVSPETIENIAKKAREAEDNILNKENNQENNDIIRSKL